MRYREWPVAAKVSEWTTAIKAHTRGLAGLGGHYAFTRAPGASWSASVAVPAMRAADALRFRAFLHSLRGRSGSFWFSPPPVLPTAFGQTCPNVGSNTVFDDCTVFTTTTGVERTFDDPFTGSVETVAGTTAAIAADGNTATLTGFDTARLVVGAYALVGSDQYTAQLVRITEVAGAVITFAPRVRRAVASGETVNIGRVSALFRLAGQVPAVPLVNGRSEPMTIEIEEAY